MNIGLSDNEVILNRKKYGTNEITKIKKKTLLKMFVESFSDPIIKILLIALTIKILFIFSKYDWYETIGIYIAVFLASLISTISEYASNEAFNNLQKDINNIKVKVYRNNILKEILINDIVVNDIIKLNIGDSIPADGILINGNITCNESTLTGEAKDINKNRNDLLFRGTFITNGSGILKVLKVGNNTEYGKIYLSIQEDNPTSPLKIRLYKLAKIISRIGYIGAFIVSFSYLFNKIIINNNFDVNLIINMISNPKIIINDLIYALSLTVTIIIVCVPEGLPMMITLVLSSNMKRMLKDNVLVRYATGIETSGNLNYLLTDKTGTLTKGILEVTSIVTSDLKVYKSDKLLKNTNIYDDIYKGLVINNESEKENNNVIGGNPTDKALLYFFKDYKKIKIDKKIPFSSDKKYSEIIIDNISYIKGASEILIDKCNKKIDRFGNIKDFNNKSLINNEILKYMQKGIRIVSLIKRINNDYIYIGFVTLKDELRDVAKDAINTIKNAKINVIMITGDAYETAKNIAIDSNIINSPLDIALTSYEFNKMDDEEIKKNLNRIKLIARALPKDKLRMVNIIEEMDYIVGMTGDGVNDAPALKKANVGFAMGSGTEVAKEASDIIILDDNILSISKAILYGRTIFKSIRRFVTYQLTINIIALLLSIIGSYIGISTPITIIQMLWLNMIMDTFAAIAFSYEAPLPYYMNANPKDKNESIINKYMYSSIIINGLYGAILCILFLKLPIFKILIRNDYKHFMTAYFALFIFIGIFNAFIARSERLNILSNISKNKIFIFIFAFIIVVQIFIIYNGNNLFRTYGLYYKELLIVVFLAFSVIPIDFIRKLLLKKKGISLTI